MQIVAIWAVLSFLAVASQAQSYSVLYSFYGTTDGFYAEGGVSLDRAGNLYGTTAYGGHMTCFLGCGAAFKLAPRGSGWVLIPLYDFLGGSDGGNPAARLIVGPDGSLYGTTTAGGNTGCSGGCGVVFSLRPPLRPSPNLLAFWTETVLHAFTSGNDGALPLAGDLLFDQAGSIYGTTQYGGGGDCRYGCGVVYKLTHTEGSWTESLVHTFAQSGDGAYPVGGVIFDSTGSLYGTTTSGGINGNGTVYQLTPSGNGWSERLLHSFQGAEEGQGSTGGLILDPLGNLLGTTCCNGPGDGGTAFELTRSQDFAFSTLYAFQSSFQGGGPVGGLVTDAAGNLYGTTSQAGAYGFGAIFKLTPGPGGWTYTSLHDFCPDRHTCADGAFPSGTLAIDSQGNLYGTTTHGGTYAGGVVFRFKTQS